MHVDSRSQSYSHPQLQDNAKALVQQIAVGCVNLNTWDVWWRRVNTSYRFVRHKPP